MGLTDWFSSSSPRSSSSDSSSSRAFTPELTTDKTVAINAPPSAAATTPNKFVTVKNPTGIKPCCACPDTKAKRDDCFLANGPGSEACSELVARHRQCMEELGFKI